MMEIDYDTIFNYLQHPHHPYTSECSGNDKRAIRKKAKKFVIKDGVLHNVHGSSHRQWITDMEQQKKIMKSCHSDKLGGHFGRDKTREKISSRLDFTTY